LLSGRRATSVPLPTPAQTGIQGEAAIGYHGRFARIGLLALAMGACLPARAELDLALFRAASCKTLASEYAAVRDVNPTAVQEMRRTDSTSPDTANPGIAGLAGLGLRGQAQNEKGDDSMALADLSSYRQAIVIVAAEKKCALPGSGPGLYTP
jgi:hypothetical protein